MAMASSNQEDEKLELLTRRLESLPFSMEKFARGLRTLFAENRVDESMYGVDEGTRACFIEVRDNVHKNALVYIDRILPITENVVREIGTFADYFIELDFVNWVDCLPDILHDLEHAVGYCKILQQMHNTVIVDLMKQQDKVTVSMVMMDEMTEQYRKEVGSLRSEAIRLTGTALAQRLLGLGFVTLPLYPLTLSLVLNSWADENVREARLKTAESVAKNRNADIATCAVLLTKATLIPSIQDFMDGIETCRMFLVHTKESLIKMQAVGGKEKKKLYYTMMQAHAKKLSGNSMQFLMMTDMMRNNLASIPNDGSHKNYVDLWMEEQTRKFEKENKDIWSKIGSNLLKMVTGEKLENMLK